MASAASTLSLQADILADCVCSDNDSFQAYLSDWSSAFGTLPGNLPPKQPFWDSPGILADVAEVKSSLSTPAQMTSFLAASSPHSGDWLQAMPISSRGLRLDDEAVRIGVGMWLGVPHYCGALVDAQRLYGFVCKKAPGRPATDRWPTHTLQQLPVKLGQQQKRQPLVRR